MARLGRGRVAKDPDLKRKPAKYKLNEANGLITKGKRTPADSPPEPEEFIGNYLEDPVKAKAWAKVEYMRGKNSLDWICHWGKIPHDLMRKWVFLGTKAPGKRNEEQPWANERNSYVNQAVQEVVSNMSVQLQNCLGHCIWIVGETLARYSEQNREYTLDEMEQITKVAKELQSMMQVSKGEPAKMFGLDINVNKGVLNWDMVKRQIINNDILTWDENVPKPRLLDKKAIEHDRQYGREAKAVEPDSGPQADIVRPGDGREAEPAPQGQAVPRETDPVIQCDLQGWVPEGVHRQGEEGRRD